MTALVRASGLRGYSALVSSVGGNTFQLAKDCGIAPEVLDDEEALIPYRQLIHLMEHSATELGVADFGMRLAAAQDVGILGSLAVAIQNASTIEQALRCAANYIFVQSAALQLEIEDLGEETRIGVAINLSNMPHSGMRQAEDLAIGLVHRILFMLSGDACLLLRVELPHDHLCSPATYKKYFNAPVLFGCPFNSVYVQSSILKVQLSTHSSELYQEAIAYLDVQLPAPDGVIATRVETAIRRTLGTDSCNRNNVAKAMAIHPRTLHRKLEREDTTFDQIRERVRREKVEYYLRYTSAPLAQVASIVGYAEQAVLSRNCRRWFGQAPREYRAAHSR